MRLFALLLSVLLALPACASDYGREKKWADEVLPGVMTGDPVWLQQADGHQYLALLTAVPNAKAGLIVLHGMGVHPDWGLIGPLRQNLPESGYATLSVQLPVLAADAKSEQYASTLDEAAGRIAQAVAFMQAKGYSKIALVSHSLGCRMADTYLSKHPDAPIVAWAAIGASGAPDFGRLKFPVLDLYGETDLPQVLQGVKKRAAGLKRQSAQVQVPGADHFFEGRDAVLLEQVKGFLDRVL